MMHCHELGAVREGPFHLHVINHLGHAGHDLVATEKLPSEIHQLGYAFAIPDEFEQLGRDQRHGFGMIEPNAARESFLREKACVAKQLKPAPRNLESSAPPAESSRNASISTFLPPRSTSLRLKKRRNLQRSPRAVRPADIQSTNSRFAVARSVKCWRCS